MSETVFITECPRDAMQGIVEFIPTEKKIAYLNLLLKVGFDRLDFGSFVSPKAIPQLRDTAEVLEGLEDGSATELLAIIANVRGAQDAVTHERIRFLGFPFSVSETFQLRNTNSTREESLDRVKEIVAICAAKNKTPLIYLSMGFGNPYGDVWNEEIVATYAEALYQLGVRHLALADTVGNSSPDKIRQLYPYLTKEFSDVEWGIHLHSTPQESHDKIEAALAVGCRRFDTALRGFGGCPMAEDELVGNIATENLLSSMNTSASGPFQHKLNRDALETAMDYSWQIFK
jgi:hydroxymethylglutaryl-CoA lyase